MKNDLIPRADAIESIKEDLNAVDPFDIDAGIKRACINRAAYKIASVPAVDAVEVVRCRECRVWEKYENTAGCGYCHNKRFRFLYGGCGGSDERAFEPITEPDFSCMDGQRKDDDGDG